MKNVIPIFILVLFCVLCLSHRTDKIIRKDDLDRLIGSFKIINGDWAQSSYIEDLSKTKSPYKSQGKLASVVELNIDTSSSFLK